MDIEPTSSPGKTRKLDGEVALVTGGASGIGKAIARQLVDAGARVAVFDINETATRAVADELGETAVAIPGDCTDRVAVTEAVSRISGQFGDPAILVQSAGVADPCPGDRLDPAAWERTVAVNLTGAFNLLYACLPSMMKRRRGSVLSIASVSGHRGGQDRSVAYAATKGGLIAMTRALAAQLGPYGITVNSLSPGIVRTELTVGLLAGIPADALRTAIPLGREATPDEIASAAVFLVGPDAAYVNGADLAVDGGLINTYRV